MELNIRLLRTFRVVAGTRNFTAAAKQLKLTQSSVSQQISALESDLGVQLLRRSNRFVGLTTAGEIFLQCAGQVIDNLDRVRGILADQAKPTSGHLAIGVPALFGHALFPAVLNTFHLRYPRIALSVITMDPVSMAARLAHRELDLALLPFPVEQRSLGIVQLGRDELVAIVAPGHQLARDARLHPDDLRGQPLIIPNPGNPLWSAWDAFLLEAGVFPEIIVETDDLDLAKHLVIRGYGASVAPRWSVEAEVDGGKLRAMSLGPSGVWRQWFMAYHHGAELSGMRRNFLAICQQELPRLLGAGIKRPPQGRPIQETGLHVTGSRGHEASSEQS